MRKILSLLLALFATMSVAAKKAVMFDINIDDTKITVTPSDLTADYYFYVLHDNIKTEYETNNDNMFPGLTNNDEFMFALLCNFVDVPYQGVKEFDLNDYATAQNIAKLEGTYHAYASLVEGDDQLGYQPASDATYLMFTYTEEKEAADLPVFLHFGFYCDDSNFTLTPDNDEQDYYFWVFSQEEIDGFLEDNLTISEVMEQLVSDYCTDEYVYTGRVSNSYEEDYWCDALGKYYVVAVPVKYVEEDEEAEGMYVVAGNSSVFTFDYTYAPVAGVSEANSVDDLILYEIEFDRAEEVAVSDFGVLGAVFDEEGKAYAIFSSNLFEGAEGVAINENKATINFKLISEIEEELAPAIDEEDKEEEGNEGSPLESPLASLRKIAGGAIGGGKATIVVASKSFVLDGTEVYDKAIVTRCNITGQGGVTGIHHAIADAAARIYDLQGRRVVAPAKGKFIIKNGAKVIR